MYPANEAFEVANYSPGNYVNYPGTLVFGYSLQNANVVERSNLGAELIESGEVSGNALIPLNEEVILGKWQKKSIVEQVIGVPFLIRIPVLRYIFGTVTRQQEVTHVCVSVKASLLNTAKPEQLHTGILKRIK